MPRKEVVIGVAAQDVQISGSMTGCHVGAYPLALLIDEGSPRILFGALISGVSFFDVQEARMSRVHGCTGATFSYLFFVRTKKRYTPLKGGINS